MNLSRMFYKDEPLFGLDIKHDSLKVMQVDTVGPAPARILGYGSSQMDPRVIENGVIVKPEAVAEALHQLFENNLVGTITSRRVACSLPTSKTFSRPMKLPPMEHADIVEAVQLEAQQYIPVPTASLYLDYEISRRDEQGIELLLVAAPRTIVDSYQRTLEALKLEPVAFEPGINAASRLVQMLGDSSAGPAIIVDIGAVSTDIAVFDKTLLVASAVSSGDEQLISLISQHLHVSVPQAVKLKSEFGIAYSDRQQRIIDAIEPALASLVHEIEKSIRYFSERAVKDHQITQVITVGSGSVMPGLNQYLSKELRLSVQNLEPWQAISFDKLTQPDKAELASYVTVAGEAVLNPAEVLR